MSRLLLSLTVALSGAGCAHVGPGAEGETMPTVRFVHGDAGKLAVEEGGAGTALPVVFVHGMLGSREAFRPQIDHLRKTRRVVALDLRGMGASEPDPQGRYGPLPFAQDLASAVDALQLDRFVLVAHSFGGAAATAYAARFPQRVAAIVYVDSATDFRDVPEAQVKQLQEQMAPAKYPAFVDGYFRQILENASPEVTERVVATAKAAPRDVMVNGFEAMRRYDSAADAKKYTGPRHAIVAEQFVGPQSMHVLHGFSADVMTGVSHWLMLDQPEAFNAKLDAFLATVTR